MRTRGAAASFDYVFYVGTVHAPFVGMKSHIPKPEQTWLETMEATAAENGTDRPLDQLIDEELRGRAPRHRKNGDPPIADRGAGGRRGDERARDVLRVGA